MKKAITLDHPIIFLGLPLALIAFTVLLTYSKAFQLQPNSLTTAITLDLLITIPFVYFLLIRKKDIPKFTVFTMFIVGLITASLILPTSQRSLLDWVMTYILPIVETTVLITLIYKVVKINKAYKTQKLDNPDFFNTITQAATEILPGRVGKLLATEVSVIHYALLNWKKRPLKINEYTYHKKSGIIMILSFLLALLLVETLVLHVVVEKWNVTVAWVLTFLSLYTMIQFIGIMRSMNKRPIFLDKDNGLLHLKYGFYSQTTLPIKAIDRIEFTTRTLPEEQQVIKLSPVGDIDSHNIVLYLNEEQILDKFYGFTKTFKTIAFFVDDKEKFGNELQEMITC